MNKLMKPTIKKFLGSPEVKKLAVSTQQLYGYALLHLEGFCQENNLISLQSFHAHIPEFVKDLEDGRISGKSIQQYLTIIKIMFRWGKQPIEYTHRLSNAEIKTNKKKALNRWFSESEVEKSLAYRFEKYSPALALRNRIMVRLMVETGARVREISFIEAKDVDFTESLVWLRESKTEPRPAFFSPETHELLKEYESAGLGLLESWKGNLFPSVNAAKAIIREMLIDLKLKKSKDGRGSHCYRHYCATMLYYKGMKMSDIAILLGDKEETIRDHYIHLTPGMLREKVQEVMGWKVSNQK